MRAVSHDVQGIAGQAVIREVIVQRTLTAGITVGVDADGLAAVARLIGSPILNTEAGHDLDVLGGITADLHIIFKLLGRQNI